MSRMVLAPAGPRAPRSSSFRSQQFEEREVVLPPVRREGPGYPLAGRDIRPMRHAPRRPSQLHRRPLSQWSILDFPQPAGVLLGVHALETPSIRLEVAMISAIWRIDAESGCGDNPLPLRFYRGDAHWLIDCDDHVVPDCALRVRTPSCGAADLIMRTGTCHRGCAFDRVPSDGTCSASSRSVPRS
jgi:hypothetical protein